MEIDSTVCGTFSAEDAKIAGEVWIKLTCKSPILGTSVKVITTKKDYLNFSKIEVDIE